MNEGFFGGGDQSAAGAGGDAIFTLFHQDVGLFLLPTIVIVMLVVQLLVGEKLLVVRATIIGTLYHGVFARRRMPVSAAPALRHTVA